MARLSPRLISTVDIVQDRQRAGLCRDGLAEVLRTHERILLSIHSLYSVCRAVVCGHR